MSALKVSEAVNETAFYSFIHNDLKLEMYKPPSPLLHGMHMHQKTFARNYCTFCHSTQHARSDGETITCPSFKKLLIFKMTKDLHCTNVTVEV